MDTTLLKPKVVHGEAAESGAATGRGACRGPSVVIKRMPGTLSGVPLARSEKRITARGC